MLSASQEANAMGNKEEVPHGITSCEEMIGVHKYQVSRVLVKAAPCQVQSVLTDYEHTTQVFPELKKCQIVSESGPEKNIAFTANAPGSLFSFDYVLQVREIPGYIEWHRVSGAFKQNEGFWKLEPTDDGRSTLVTYAKFIDGGLFVPQMFVNKELKASMPQVLANLKVSAEQNSRVAHVDSPNKLR
jgi:ribosome-associated toxin RatA of RatAB toxin-antitoxin module